MKRSVAFLALVLLTMIAANATGQVLLPVLPGHEVFDVVDIAGLTWAATKKGAYRLDGLVVDPVFEDAAVFSVAEVSQRVWLGTNKGLYEDSAVGASPLYKGILAGKRVRQILPTAQGIWLATRRGLFRVSLDRLELDPDPFLGDQEVYSMAASDTELVLGTSGGAYAIPLDVRRFDAYSSRLRSDPEGCSLLNPKAGLTIAKVTWAAGAFWLIPDSSVGFTGSVLRFEPIDPVADAGLENLGSIDEVLLDDFVSEIVEVGNEAWIGTTRGFYVYRGGIAQRELPRFADTLVDSVALVEDEPWFAVRRRSTDPSHPDPVFDGIWSRSSGVYGERYSSGRADLVVSGVFETDQGIWIRDTSPNASRGLSRLVSDARVAVDLRGHGTLESDESAISLHFGRQIVIAAKYEGTEGLLGEGEGVDWRCEVLENSKPVTRAETTSGDGCQRVLNWGRHDLQILVQDPQGNKGKAQKSFYVLTWAPWMTGVSGWVGVVGLLSLLAGWSQMVVSVLTSVLLKYFDFAVALVYSKGYRRWIMRSYLQKLIDGANSSESDPPPWVDMLLRQRTEGLGGLEMGESLRAQRLEELAGWIARRELAAENAPQAIPIVADLDFCSECTVEDFKKWFLELLPVVSGVREGFALSMLRRGGFLFLLQGCDRFSDKGRRGLKAFTEIYRLNSFVLVVRDKSKLKGLDKWTVAAKEESSSTVSD